MTGQKVALVTGASSGFGELIAVALAREGYRVFGTSRKQQVNPAKGIEMLVLDVQSDQSVQSLIERLHVLTDRIDLLVNNAGQAHASLIEETSLEQAQSILDTNFWGVVRLTRAILPLMRQQGFGRIINIGSMAGLLGVPGQGFYSASKFALEGFSEALRLEVEQFNIFVTLVEPGFFKTGLHRKMLPGNCVIDDYSSIRRAVESAVINAISQGGDPQMVAEAVVRIAGSKSPRLRYRIGNDAVWVPRLKSILPESWFFPSMRKRFNLP